MDLELTPTQKQIQDTARQYAQQHLVPNARALDREERFPLEAYAQLADLGLLGVNIKSEYGGAEAGVVSYALAMMELAAGCAATAVGMGVTNMAAELIQKVGTPAQCEKFIPLLTSGKAVVGAFALSEAHCGSDAGALRTTAVKQGNRYVLNGAKQWITSGTYAGVFVVWARTSATGNRGISAFIVEGKPPGLTAGKPEEKMGLRGSNTVPLVFENCEIPEENLLGKEGDGFKLAMIALDGGRIGIASQACGIASAALEASIQYAQQREAFGKPIGQFQAIQNFIAQMKTDLTAAQLLTFRAAYLKDQGHPFTREASMAKVFASEMVNRVCDKAVQIHGGYGYTNEFPVERHFRDARVTTIYEGTSEIQRLVIARELFKTFSA